MTTTLVKNPLTGAFESNMDPTGRSMTDLNGGGGTPPANPGDVTGGNSSYTNFNTMLMGILKAAQTVGSTAPLYGQKDALVNESLNLSNPLNSTPYAPIFQGMTPKAQIAAQGDTQSAFNPGITSVTSQIQAENDAANKFIGLVDQARQIATPISTPLGSSRVDRGGNVVFEGSKYYPVLNPLTGVYQLFDLSTGEPAGVSPNENTKNIDQTVGAVDFSGLSTGVGAYATDPSYVAKVRNIYQDITSSLPSMDPRALTTYIQHNAKNAPVTGDMVVSSAHKYDVDPALLASVLNLESGFGTAGVGARTNNPGNVGNTDSGASKTFASWQAGVDATAHELARRQVASGSQTAIPAQIQAAIQTIGDVKYIDASTLTSGQLPYAQAISTSTGIPLLAKDDADKVQTAYQSYQSAGALIKQVKDLTEKVITADNNPLHMAEQGIHLKQIELYPWTSTDNEGKQFVAARNSVLSLITRAAGEKGTLTDMDVDRIRQALPSYTDTQELAAKKSQNLDTVLKSVYDGAIKSYIGTKQVGNPVNAAPGTPAQTGLVSVKSPNGTPGKIPASQLSTALSQGYTQL